MGAEDFRFDGRRALVVGGATGMGAATAKLLHVLGAEVVVMDNAPVTFEVDRAIEVDLRQPASIDRGIELAGNLFHTVFLCAGITNPTPGVLEVNFLGPRHLVDALLSRTMLPSGSAIGVISSIAGLGWETNLDPILELLALRDFEEGVAWSRTSPEYSSYRFSKQTMSAYVAREAFPLLQQGIRINAIQPGTTDTPLARANANTWFPNGREYREAAGIALSTPEEQANVLVFACSDAASYMTGTNIVTDAGRSVWRMMHAPARQ